MTDIKSQVLSIVDDLENPPMVLVDDPTLTTEDANWYYDDDKEMWFDDEGELRDDEEVTTMSAYDYLSEALEIQYIVNSKREFLGARILVAFGGPNIWIDTKHDTVEGFWWGESHTEHFTDEMGLHDACADLWEMTG